MSFTLTLTAGAFLLAAWVDGRCDGHRPETPGRRIVHVAASCILLQLAGVGAGLVAPEHSGVTRQLTAVLMVILPILVYAFVSGLWLIRTLAEVGFARR